MQQRTDSAPNRAPPTQIPIPPIELPDAGHAQPDHPAHDGISRPAITSTLRPILPNRHAGAVFDYDRSAHRHEELTTRHVLRLQASASSPGGVPTSQQRTQQASAGPACRRRKGDKQAADVASGMGRTPTSKAAKPPGACRPAWKQDRSGTALSVPDIDADWPKAAILRSSFGAPCHALIRRALSYCIYAAGNPACQLVAQLG